MRDLFTRKRTQASILHGKLGIRSRVWIRNVLTVLKSTVGLGSIRYFVELPWSGVPPTARLDRIHASADAALSRDLEALVSQLLLRLWLVDLVFLEGVGGGAVALSSKSQECRSAHLRLAVLLNYLCILGEVSFQHL